MKEIQFDELVNPYEIPSHISSLFYKGLAKNFRESEVYKPNEKVIVSNCVVTELFQNMVRLNTPNGGQKTVKIDYVSRFLKNEYSDDVSHYLTKPEYKEDPFSLLNKLATNDLTEQEKLKIFYTIYEHLENPEFDEINVGDRVYLADCEVISDNEDRCYITTPYNGKKIIKKQYLIRA